MTLDATFWGTQERTGLMTGVRKGTVRVTGCSLGEQRPWQRQGRSKGAGRWAGCPQPP